jgi:hypothetical protein
LSDRNYKPIWKRFKNEGFIVAVLGPISYCPINAAETGQLSTGMIYTPR